MDAQSLWYDILAQLGQITSQRLARWAGSRTNVIEPDDLADGVLHVSVDHPGLWRHLNERRQGALWQAMRRAGCSQYELHLKLSDEIRDGWDSYEMEYRPSEIQLPNEFTQDDWLEMGVPLAMVDATFDTLDWEHSALANLEPEGREALLDYFARPLDFWKARPGLPCLGLALCGAAGVGKTRLMVCLLKIAAAHGWVGQLVNVPEMLADIRATWDEHADKDAETESEIVNRARWADVLILDDLNRDAMGKDRWGAARLAPIIRRRYSNGFPTLVTTNHTSGNLFVEAGLEPSDASRLVSSCLLMTLKGPDYRQIEKQKALAQVRQRRLQTPGNRAS